MDFYEWMISKYLKKNSPRGDLADDMKGDKSFPRDAGHDTIESHLIAKHACRECRQVFERCWKSYQKAKDQQTAAQ